MQRKKDEDSGDEAVERGGVGLSARLHPFFLLTLNDSSWETFLAGLFLEVGANLEFTSIEAASVESDLGWRLGFGTDFPLTSFDKGWSLWLGISFRAKFVDLRTPSGGLTSVDEGVVLMSIGYRNHDINFTRWPRPSEFKETPEDIGE